MSVITISKTDVIQLSDHFWSNEFNCGCNYDECDFTYIDSDLFAYLERKRGVLGGRPFILNSGFRCARHNRDVNGKSGSSHLNGKAADFYIPGETMLLLADQFEDADGLGRYIKRADGSNNFIHVDGRGYKARWIRA